MRNRKSKEKRECYYFLYRRGRKVQVSREEWEKSWLDWYLASKKSEEN